MTAPTVVAQTTSESERPTCEGSARSTAAKRDCRLAAVRRAEQREPEQHERQRVETADPSTVMTAPTAPSIQPSGQGRAPPGAGGQRRRAAR